MQAVLCTNVVSTMLYECAYWVGSDRAEHVLHGVPGICA